MQFMGQSGNCEPSSSTRLPRSGKFTALFSCVLLCVTALNAESTNSAYQELISDLHAELGIPSDYKARTGLPLQSPPKALTDVGKDMFGRSQRLDNDAARAWRKMLQAATADDVSLLLVSAFRPLEYQRDLLRRKLRAGESIDEALQAVAAPGHSEHQSGRAVDVSCAGCPVLETDFENTQTFRWLMENAETFGFFLSYPRDNPHAIMYEPWHWCYKEDADHRR